MSYIDAHGNVALGQLALKDLVIAPVPSEQKGYNNTAVGTGALRNMNKNANESTGIGVEAFAMNAYGESTGVGAYAGATNTGQANTAIGGWALRFNQYGSDNTAVGFRAMACTSTPTSESVPNLGNNGNGSKNTAVGRNALRCNKNGHENVAIGYNALLNNLDGVDNCALGSRSLEANTDGKCNTAQGKYSLHANQDGSDNTAVGFNALAMNTANQNTAVGSGALASNQSGTGNTAEGYGALGKNVSGGNNTGVGLNALAENISGHNNVAIGYETLKRNVNGSNNVAIGTCGPSIGSDNTVIGHSAGELDWNRNNVTLIGQKSDVTMGSLTYATAIGSGATVGQSSSVVLGRTIPRPLADEMRVLPISSAEDRIGIGTTTPRAALHVHGNIINCMNVKLADGDYQMESTDSLVIAVKHGTKTIRLPWTSELTQGQMFYIKNTIGDMSIGLHPSDQAGNKIYMSGYIIGTNPQDPIYGNLTTPNKGTPPRDYAALSIIYYPTVEKGNEKQTHFWVLSGQ